MADERWAICSMTEKQAAQLFVAAMLDKIIPQEEREALVKGWNDAHGGRVWGDIDG